MSMTAKVLWVTGAGSGIGRASALEAAAAGRVVVLSGRRVEALADTAARIVAAGGKPPLQLALDVQDVDALIAAHLSIESAVGTVDELVLAAGLNTPDRRWADQSMATFASILETNLMATARAIDLVLPGMRAAGAGTIIAVSSIAAWRLSPAAGVAYTASKRGLKSLTETLNGQEGKHGIRATLLLPGDVDSAFLAQRAEVPDETVRSRMLSPEDIGRTVRFILDSPQIVCIDELVISPTGF